MTRTLLTVLGLSVMFAPAWAEAQGRPGAGGAAQVIVSGATQENFVDRVEAIGTLRANETIMVTSKVTDTVTAINFEDGQQVAKGDILVEMTGREEKALLDQQKAMVKEASTQLQRARELAKTGASSAATLEERQRQYSVAIAGMAALQSRLEDRIITAPFDGIVGLRNISVGTLLQPGIQITTLDDISVMKLDFSVPSLFLPTLRPGLDIVARAAGFEQEFKGTISAIDSQIDPATRSVRVRAILPNPEGALKPGLLMTVDLLRSPRKSVSVPESAIIPEGRKTYVYVVDAAGEGATAEKREVTLGTRIPGAVEVVSGLSAGEKVVTEGTMMVQPGKPVKILATREKGDTLEQIIGKYQGAATEGTAQ